jgi:hypothetical protein
MRTTLLILLHTWLYIFSCGYVENGINEEAKKLLLGKWILTNDTSFIMEIRTDSIIYYYNGAVDIKNPIEFVFSDSLINYYENKFDRFDFIRENELQSKISIIEFDMATKDTVFNTILYLDKNGLDISSRNRSVSFKKL